VSIDPVFGIGLPGRPEKERPMGVFDFWRRNPHERAGSTLYVAAVAAARDPWLYAAIGVPDTLDGRFDLIGLHTYLVIRRLQALPPPAADLAQAVFDAMFRDMDVNLREMGVGDLSVGKKVKVMWEAFHGRATAYARALDAAGAPDLPAALARNVWRGAAAGDGPARLAAIVLAQQAHLAGQPLIDGQVVFLAAETVAPVRP
jgi:cytochrome b pre-mRNA-processing protein 3